MNVERLQQAIAIITDIPATKFDLEKWQQSTGPFPTWADSLSNTHCGTVACAAGWISLYPQFQELGMRVIARGGRPVFVQQDQTWMGIDAMARLFDLRDVEADNLFCGRRYVEKVDPRYSQLTDKELWLFRARRLLEKYDSEMP